MAEFCKDCFIKKLTTPSDNITDEMLIMSDTWEFCEGCCEVKPIVTAVEKKRNID